MKAIDVYGNTIMVGDFVERLKGCLWYLEGVRRVTKIVYKDVINVEESCLEWDSLKFRKVNYLNGCRVGISPKRRLWYKIYIWIKRNINHLYNPHNTYSP